MSNNLNEKDRFGRPIERKPTDQADAMAKVTHRREDKVAGCVACSIGLGFAIGMRSVCA